MIAFEVKLIRVPPISELSGWDVFDLMVDARHVDGDLWIFEGDIEALSVPGIELVATGISDGYGHLDEDTLVKHCDDIFPVDVLGGHPAWRMSLEHREQGL